MIKVKIKVPFVKNEYYHIYNRGVDKRIIFNDYFDILRFIQSMEEFNSVEPIGSIYENRSKKCGDAIPTSGKLVEIVAYCLNPNHFHLILTPLVEGGISEFMRRMSIGYTIYFNQKYNRTGSLFGGTFKSVYIDSDSYLRFLSVYINLNFEVHQKFQNSKSQKLWHKSSWEEYVNTGITKGRRGEESQLKKNENDICEKKMILSHFNSAKDYKKFAEETLKNIKEERYGDKDLLKKDFTIGKEF